MSRIDDGFQTQISFSEDASGLVSGIVLFEKEVTPPGIQGGGENDVTTMRNETWRTKAPKQLMTLSPCSFVAAYDPAIYDDILAMIQVNQQITITFPDGATLVFWGWLDEFTPGALAEGTQPTASCTIVPSNQNGSGVETAPIYTEPA